MNKEAKEILEAKAKEFYHTAEARSHQRGESIFMIGAKAGFELGQTMQTHPVHTAEVVKCGFNHSEKFGSIPVNIIEKKPFIYSPGMFCNHFKPPIIDESVGGYICTNCGTWVNLNNHD